MGYDYFYELCDPLHAAEQFRQASLLPGAPAYLPKLAARMTVEGGDPNAALEFLTRFAQQTQDERLREALRHRFKEVMSERDIKFLEEGVQRFSTTHHKFPVTLDDLVKVGIIDRVPHSPFGGSYVLNPMDGRVSDPGLRERLHVHRHVDCQTMKNSPVPQGPALLPRSLPQTR